MSISIRPFERTNSRIPKSFRKKIGPHSVDPPPKKRHNFNLFKDSCVGEKKSVADVIRLTVFHVCISLILSLHNIYFKKFMSINFFVHDARVRERQSNWFIEELICGILPNFVIKFFSLKMNRLYSQSLLTMIYIWDFVSFLGCNILHGQNV